MVLVTPREQQADGPTVPVAGLQLTAITTAPLKAPLRATFSEEDLLLTCGYP